VDSQENPKIYRAPKQVPPVKKFPKLDESAILYTRIDAKNIYEREGGKIFFYKFLIMKRLYNKLNRTGKTAGNCLVFQGKTGSK